MCFVDVSYCITMPCKVMSATVYTGVCEVVFGSVILYALWSDFSYCYTVPCKVMSDVVYTGVREVVFDIVLLGFVN